MIKLFKLEKNKTIRIIIAISILTILGLIIFLYNANTNNSLSYTISESLAKVSDKTVYITETGTKYHRYNCQFLNDSKIEVKMSQLKKKYTPCSKCNPPLR